MFELRQEMHYLALFPQPHLLTFPISQSATVCLNQNCNWHLFKTELLSSVLAFLCGGNGIPKSQSHNESSHFGLLPETKCIVHACVSFSAWTGIFVARSSQHFQHIMLVALVNSELCKLRDNITNICSINYTFRVYKKSFVVLHILRNLIMNLQLLIKRGNA